MKIYTIVCMVECGPKTIPYLVKSYKTLEEAEDLYAKIYKWIACHICGNKFDADCPYEPSIKKGTNTKRYYYVRECKIND